LYPQLPEYYKHQVKYNKSSNAYGAQTAWSTNYLESKDESKPLRHTTR
jgi:hypothetical protein